jgi:hypothetical protein
MAKTRPLGSNEAIEAGRGRGGRDKAIEMAEMRPLWSNEALEAGIRP